MGRQLFLHHYLPAHLASALVTGALVEFIFNIEPLSEDELASAAQGTAKVGRASRTRPVRESIGSNTLWMAWAATGVILSVVVWSFLFFAPLTYGFPGLDVEGVVRRKWLGYDLHFAK